MQFKNHNANVFIPDGTGMDIACQRTTHLGVGAHQDDLEFMALHGIVECFHSDHHWFTGVTCTNGAGSTRSGVYANCSDEHIQALRRKEQNQAALIGRYTAMFQLDYPSAVIKNSANHDLQTDLHLILETTRPEFIYTHNPADKHESHIAVVIPLLAALRELSPEQRPKKVYGCEIWRGLDWLGDEQKIVHDLTGYEHLAFALNGVFDSQIASGKRYDLAVMGRRRANATFFKSHVTDHCELANFVMDLTPLISDPRLDIIDYTTSFIEDFKQDVITKLKHQLGR